VNTIINHSKKSEAINRILTILFVCFSVLSINAQLGVQSYLDAGKNNVSEGVYLKSALRADYGLEDYHFETGIQFDLIHNNPKVLSAFDFVGGRNLAIKEFPIDVKAFFLLNRFSDLLHEINWGLRAGTIKFEHWNLELGTNSKTYVINRGVRERFGLENSRNRVTEALDLTYLVTYLLMPHENDWNVGLSLTNVDYFLVNQSTNPSFKLLSYYKPIPKLTVNLSARYHQAAIFNIYSSHFGFIIRGGARWEI
jgi:hypothetical protein